MGVRSLLRRRLAWAALVSLAALAAASAALAQSQTTTAQTPPQTAAQPAPSSDQKSANKDAAKDKKPADKSTTVKGVVVTAVQPAVRTDIDRRSYDLTKDLMVQSGASLADVLRNVPSLDVDLNGNITIRGQGVQILVDGKPSGLFKGGSVGQMLQQLPADEYERVEVMTNPSAAFSPDGSGGIVNLITKKTHKTGRSGSVRAGVGLDGRYNVGLTGAWRGDKLTLSAGVNYASNPQRNQSVIRRQTFDDAGDLLTSIDQTGRTLGGGYASFNARLSADYDLDPATRLSASIHGNGSDPRSNGAYVLTGMDPSGAVDQVLDIADAYRSTNRADGASVSVRHNFPGDEHDVVVSLSRDRSGYARTSDSSDTSQLPIVPELFNQRRTASAQTFTDLKADYEGPLPHEAKLKVGYDLQVEQNAYDSAGFEQALSPLGPLDPTENDLFRAERRIEAGYVTYQQPFGKLTVLLGLRLEDTHIDLDQVVQAIRFKSDDFQVYPTLHLQWTLDDAQSLLASFSRRVQRPDLQSLDPFRVIYDPFDASAGNPALLPEQTQQFELGYQYKKGSTVYIATAFAKLNTAGVTDVTTIIGPNDFLDTQENLTRSREIGLELDASGKLGKDWTYNLGTNGYQRTIDASNIGFITPRSDFEGDLHASLTWQATPKDLFQFWESFASRRETPQGYDDGHAFTFVGYRHKFDDHLSFLVQVNDVFNNAHFLSVIDTPTIKAFNDYRPRFQTVMFTVNYAFGAGPKRDPGFDVGN